MGYIYSIKCPNHCKLLLRQKRYIEGFIENTLEQHLDILKQFKKTLRYFVQVQKVYVSILKTTLRQVARNQYGRKRLAYKKNNCFILESYLNN